MIGIPVLQPLYTMIDYSPFGAESYSMSYVLILNRKHFPVSFIRRRITFSALSCCKRISFWLLPSEPIIDTIRENNASSEYARITTRENLKNTRYWIADSRVLLFFPTLYQIYYIYTFTSFTLYVIWEEKDFFSTNQLLKYIFSLQKFA